MHHKRGITIFAAIAAVAATLPAAATAGKPVIFDHDSSSTARTRVAGAAS